MTARDLETLTHAAIRCKIRGLSQSKAEQWLQHWGPDARRVIAEVYA